MALDMINFMEEFITDPESSYKTTERLGSGMYASVFDSDMPNMVVKAGSRTESGTCLTDGWLVWAIYCMNRAQKHGIGWSFMPCIHGLVINYDTGEFHAVMERLYDSKYGESKRAGKPNFSGYFNYRMIENDVTKWDSSWSSGKIRRPKTIMKALKEIDAFFKANGEEETPLFIDGHPGNWMWRKCDKRHTLVMTDPFVCSSEFYEKDGGKRYNELLMKMAEGNPKIKIIGKPKTTL